MLNPYGHIHPTQAMETVRALESNRRATLQAFVLGYYYALFQPLINCSRLDVQEATGAWSWLHDSLFFMALDFSDSWRSQRGKMSIDQVMGFIAFLYAGVEMETCRTLPRGAIGISGKLGVLISTMLSSPVDCEELQKLYLLDLDASSIPCNARGMILPGQRRRVEAYSTFDTEAANSPSEVHEDEASDFSLHLEPDWDHDMQTCLIVYRHNGRLVNRQNPFDVLRALVKLFEKHFQIDRTRVDRAMEHYASTARTIQLKHFFDCKYMDHPKPIVIRTGQRLNALVSLLALYSNSCGYKISPFPSKAPGTLQSLSELDENTGLLVANMEKPEPFVGFVVMRAEI